MITTDRETTSSQSPAAEEPADGAVRVLHAPRDPERGSAVPTQAARRRLTMLGTVATSFLVILLQTVQAMLLARVLGPAGRGEYATAIFYTATLTYIGLAGTAFALARRAARHPDRLYDMQRTALRLGAITGLATIGVVALLALAALPAEKRYLAPLCIACSLALPLEHVRLLLMAVDQGSARFARYNAVQLVTAVSLPLLLLVVWAMGGAPMPVVALLTILSPLLGLAFRWLAGEEWNLFRQGWPGVGTVLKEGRPYALSVVVADLFGRLDMLLMLWLASLPGQGCYAAAVPAAGLLMVVPNALGLFAFNAGARHDQPLALSRLGAAMAGVVAFQALSAIALAMILKPLILLVFGRDFREAVPLALALLPALACQGCTSLADSYLRGRNRAAVGVQARILAAGVLAAGAVVMFPRYQELSVPLAASLAGAASALWMAVALIRHACRQGGDEPRGVEAISP